MTNYINSYCLVNRGNKDREVTISITTHGTFFGFVVDSKGFLIEDT